MASANNHSDALGFGPTRGNFNHGQQRVSYVTPQHALRRILSFTGHSIDDVLNSPVAHRKVLHYYRVHKLINRQSEISDLERQWNPLG